MKTRVLRKYDVATGLWSYWVQKWALWDAPDLRRAYPNDYDWRFVRAYPVASDAISVADRIAQHGHDPQGAYDDEYEVIHTAGE